MQTCEACWSVCHCRACRLAEAMAVCRENTGRPLPVDRFSGEVSAVYSILETTCRHSDEIHMSFRARTDQSTRLRAQSTFPPSDVVGIPFSSFFDEISTDIASKDVGSRLNSLQLALTTALDLDNRLPPSLPRSERAQSLRNRLEAVKHLVKDRTADFAGLQEREELLPDLRYDLRLILDVGAPG